MNRRTVAIAGVVLASCVVLTACTGPAADAPRPSTTSTAAPTVDTHGWSTPVPSSGSAGHDDEPDDPADSPVSDADASLGVQVAELFMTAFTRTDLDKAAWFGGIRGFLTDYSVTAYQYTEPASVSAHSVIGAGTVVPGGTSTIMAVDVPTDAGVYQVQLIRAVASEPWLVDRAVPPAGVR